MLTSANFIMLTGQLQSFFQLRVIAIKKNDNFGQFVGKISTTHVQHKCIFCHKIFFKGILP